MTAAADTRSFTFEVDLPHAPAKVWRALTDPTLVAKWLMPNDLKPQVGAAFQFRSEPKPWWDGIVNCEVLALEEHKRLRYSWRSSGLDTVVTWTLTPTAAGTRLTLEHAGFQPKDAFAWDGMTKGWPKIVGERLAAALSAEA